MPAGRFNHEATRLADGRVLVTGGWSYDINGNSTTLDSALVFDVTGGSYTTHSMTGARVNHTATLVADGRVVIIGGFTGAPFPSSVVEVFDPTQGNGTFSAVSATFPHWPSQHTATLLTAGPHTGSILVTSGSGNSVAGLTPATGFFNLATATYTSGPALNLARYEHAAARLPDHRIAIAGGIVEWETAATTPVVEVYDPLSNVFTVTSNLITDRQSPSIDVVDTGGTKLAVAGGWGSGALANRAIELLDVSGTALTIATASLPNGTTTGAYPATLLSASGGTPGYSFTVAWGSLPPGLTLASNGSITGAPTAGGVFEFVVKVTDSSAAVGYRALSIAVDKLTILSNSTLPAGVAGAFYSHQLQAVGSGTVTWSVEPLSTLPGSITLSASGLLSGTGPAVETFASFTLRATDASNQTITRGFTIHFSP